MIPPAPSVAVKATLAWNSSGLLESSVPDEKGSDERPEGSGRSTCLAIPASLGSFFLIAPKVYPPKLDFLSRISVALTG